MAAPISAYPTGFPSAYPSAAYPSAAYPCAAYPCAAYPSAYPAAYPTYGAGPTVVPAAIPTTSAPAPVLTAPTSTLTALPEGYYGANTVSMSYVTIPVKDPHVVAQNPTPAAYGELRNTFDSRGPSNRAKRLTQYKRPAYVAPVVYGCYKPTLKDPKTGKPTWFRARTLPAGALGTFLGGM